MKILAALLLCIFAQPGPAQTLRSSSYAAILNKSAATTASVFDTAIHYWNMENPAINVSDSKGAISLTWIAGATSVSGKRNNAGNFSADPAAEMDSASTFTLSYPFSLSFWIYYPTGGADGDVMFHNGAFGIQLAGGTLIYQELTSPNTLTAVLSADSWHLITIKSTSTTDYLSIDGGTFSTALNASATLLDDTFVVGTSLSGTFGTAAGIYLDEIALYNTGLSQPDVTTIWNAGVGTFY